MITLTIRTDKPESELGLYEGTKQLKYVTWQAHRELAETIHAKIDELLKSQQLELKGIEAVLVYKGPGSFTGLRIGLSVANALAYSLGASVVAETGEDWIERGLQRLQHNENDIAALPEYGAPVHITAPKH